MNTSDAHNNLSFLCRLNPCPLQLPQVVVMKKSLVLLGLLQPEDHDSVKVETRNPFDLPEKPPLLAVQIMI